MEVYSLLIVLVIAGVTVFTRYAPFLLFSRSGQVPRMVTYLGAIMPAAVIAMLIIYCIRSTDFIHWPYGAPELLAVGATAALHWIGRNTLLSIAGGTVFYMVLVQAVFA